jgi:hypothetical protein
MGAVILDHRRLAREHVEKLVFLFVPVSVGRTGSWLERLDICAELRHTARIRIAQRLKAAEPFRPSFVPLVVPRYTLSNDHLGGPLCRFYKSTTEFDALRGAAAYVEQRLKPDILCSQKKAPTLPKGLRLYL